MYLLQMYDRELEDMRISKDKAALKNFVSEYWNKIFEFEEIGDYIFIIDEVDGEVGVIGLIEEI